MYLCTIRYGAARGPDMSGAYLFMPSGEAVDAHDLEFPTIYVVEGHVLSQVIIQYSNVKHTVLIRHLKGILKFYPLYFKNQKKYF